MRRYTLAVLVAVVSVVVFTGVVWASDGFPWDDLAITVGSYTVLWGAVVGALVQIGKSITIGGDPLLGTRERIWAANLALGGIGVLANELLSGANVGAALLAALVAVLSAVGFFEGIKTAGKSVQSTRNTTA